MSSQLIKKPEKIVFWLVFATGMAVLFTGHSEAAADGVLSTLARTAFWCAAIAYFSLRIYQFVSRKKRAAQAETDQDENDD